MILIKNGRVMDPETGFDKVTDLVLSGGKIKSIGDTETADFEQIIDAEGMVVAPGLIDVHVHFRDPGFTHKEDMQTGAGRPFTEVSPRWFVWQIQSLWWTARRFWMIF